MKTRIILLTIVLILLLAQTGTASYSGDRLEVYQHEKIQGDLVFTIGDSKYSGEIPSGNSFDVNFETSLPDDSGIELARLYVYWSWSYSGNEGVMPGLETTFQDSLLVSDKEYTDRKGEGSYDYPSGTYAYDVTSLVSGNGQYLATVKNTGDGQSFAVTGMGLLLVYEDGGQEIEYWIGEGSDMIYAKDIDQNYTITKALFGGLDDLENIDTSTLTTVVPGGNKGKNTLYFNAQSWDGVFNGEPSEDIAIDTRDVTNYLQNTNTVNIQDSGDYMTTSNAILVVKYSPLTSSEEESDNDNQALGFEFVAAIGMLLMAYGYIGRSGKQ